MCVHENVKDHDAFMRFVLLTVAGDKKKEEVKRRRTEQRNQGEIREKRRELHVVRVERRERLQ